MSAQIRSECNDTDGSSAGLHLRRAVAEFIGGPDAYSRQADLVVAMSPQTWAKIYLSAADMQELIANGEVEMIAGEATQAAGLIELFDRYNPYKALVVPPTSLAQDPM